MKIEYKRKKFTPEQLALIKVSNQILDQYQAKGRDMTLRQLYYQLVARGYIPNLKPMYNKLGSIISDARLAGEMSWTAIVDRTRFLRKNPHWTNPKNFMEAVVPQFAVDRWAWQPMRVEVWIEKDALLGVIGGVCEPLDVPFFSCRGYTSQSELWGAAQRIITRENFDPRRPQKRQETLILHLGDHDPSGIDMTRDIGERLEMFGAHAVTVKRIALNFDQIQKYKPPPNPAKMTDPRARDYVRTHGDESWELDALDPDVLSALIERHVLAVRDEKLWEKALKEERRHARVLKKLAKEIK